MGQAMEKTICGALGFSDSLQRCSEKTLLDEADSITEEVRRTGDGGNELSRLCELAVKWVTANPNPMPLEKPDYNR